MHNTKSDPKPDYGLYLIIMCQYYFMNYNNYITLMHTISNGEIVSKRGANMGTLYCVLNFSAKPNLL